MVIAHGHAITERSNDESRYAEMVGIWAVGALTIRISSPW